MNVLLSLFISLQPVSLATPKKVHCVDLWQEPEYIKWVNSQNRDYYPVPIEQLFERCDSTSGKYSSVADSLGTVYLNLERYEDAINFLESIIGNEGNLVTNLRSQYSVLFGKLFYTYGKFGKYENSFRMIDRFYKLWSERPGFGIDGNYYRHLISTAEDSFANKKLMVEKKEVTQFKDFLIQKYRIEINREKSSRWTICEKSLFWHDIEKYNAAMSGYDLVEPEIVKRELTAILENKPALIDTTCEIEAYNLISKSFGLYGDLTSAIHFYEYLENKNEWKNPKSGYLWALIYYSGFWYHSIGEYAKARLQYLRYLAYAEDVKWLITSETNVYLRLKELEAGTGPFDPEFLLSLAP